jgi:hypothetical protein
MISKRGYLLWLKSGHIKLLLILITVLANKGVAQFESNLQLPAPGQKMIVMTDVLRPEWSIVGEESNYYMGRGEAVGIRRNGKRLRNNDLMGFNVSYYWNNEEIDLLPIPCSRTGVRNEPIILCYKSFNVAGKLYYDRQIDKMEFNLQSQLKVSSRISIQMAIFIFHVPRPWLTSLGDGKASSVSSYQLQGIFYLQKPK